MEKIIKLIHEIGSSAMPNANFKLQKIEEENAENPPDND
jgi:hypothetical protein